MMRFVLLLVLVLTVIGIFPKNGEAALFCVGVPGIPAQCLYDDAAECRARANQLGGVCGLNPAEASVTPGFGHFCLVYSSRASMCVYPDRYTCETEASRNNDSICVENATLGEQPNPYRYIPNRPY